MKLTGAEIANSGGTKFTQDVVCPWCLTASRLELGLQHVHGDLTMHCQKCSKFSRHKTADRWFDQHQERIEELKAVWKKIPNDAFISCRQSTSATPFIYTVYLGGTERPEEFFSIDTVEHILIKEWGMSWKQAHGAICSAALTPGQRIYLQRHTRLVMAAEQREEMKKTGEKEWVIPTGTPIRVNGQDGLFLRYSGNEGFAIVALPTPGVDGFGDAEVPVMELEVIDAGGPEVAEDFMFDKEMDEGLGDEENLGEEAEEVGTLEHALEHIEQAEEIVEDLVLEEGGSPADAPAEHGEVDEDEEHGDEPPSEDEEGSYEEEDGEEDEKPPFAARRKAAMPGAPRPGTDPAISQKLTNLQQIIQDPNTDPQTLQEAQRQWTQLKRQVPAALSASDLRKNAFFGYRTPDDMEAMERPKHKTKGPKLTDGKFSQEAGWVPSNEDKNPLPKEDTNLNKKANVQAQRRVHTHYAHSGDLRRAITVNRDELSIEDIRVLCKHYANVGKIAHYEADELAFWFIGDKPRLLCASDLTGAKTECPDPKQCAKGPNPHKHDKDKGMPGGHIKGADKKKCEECGQVPNKHGECSCEDSWNENRGRGRGDREDFHSDGSRKTADEEEHEEHGECGMCGGPLTPLGTLGKRKHYRCRNCGMDSSKEGSSRYEEWKRQKDQASAPKSSNCTCKSGYDRYCPEHGAQESQRGAAAKKEVKDKRHTCSSCGESFTTARENPKCPYCEGSVKEGATMKTRATLSLRDLRVSAKDAGETEIPDAHPESGVNSGGSDSNPDPKWQSGESANSVSGPEKVKDHGSGTSPKDSGDVKTPDLGVPKGARRAFTRRADGTCQKCGTPLNQAGQCPTCNSGAEQQEAQASPITPTTALSKGDLNRNRKAARHKDGCECGFCSRMRDNQNSKSKEAGVKGHPKGCKCAACWGYTKRKSVLSDNDMKKVAHDGVGIFMPALHNGTRVLVIAVDNTSLRATVQDGEGNQRQVDFADLNPVQTGPYSGMPKNTRSGVR